ncbi:RNA polymerase sigma-70 factor [Sphingobacterium multivorum]|uniref:RNA polymerase sigma-70 factor n=1 Tax=Sphingobacterium multivorum TaxID=28454 RepID=UPI0031BA86EA
MESIYYDDIHISGGIKPSFPELYHQYHHRSFLFAKSFVHLDEIAEEIASDGLIVLWEKMKTEEIISPKSFLFRVIKNKALDYLKHRKVHNRVFMSTDDWEERELELRISSLEGMDEDYVLSKEFFALVMQAVALLPAKTQEVFLKSRFEHLSGKEIADQLGISVKGVEYHMTKALRVLSIQLKDYFPLFLFFFWK